MSESLCAEVPGLLALTCNLPIVVGYSRRIENRFFFEIGATRIIFPHEWADKEDPLKWVTAEYTRAIETFVREDPSQYWWLHRRWKTQPKASRRETVARASGRTEPQAPIITASPERSREGTRRPRPAPRPHLDDQRGVEAGRL